MSVVNARGYTATHTTYDALGRPVVVEDALGNRGYTRYDALGNRVVVTDANGAVTTYGYDGLNRILSIQYPDSAIQYAYTSTARLSSPKSSLSAGDAAGSRVAMTDSLGVTGYEYDELGRLVAVSDPITGTVSYGYDLAGNRTHLFYPTGQVVTYTYNADNRLVQVEDWDGGLTTYEYDGAGRLVDTHLPNGVTSARQYDGAGRLVGLTHAAPGSGTLSGYSYELDGVGNRIAATETVSATTSVIHYTYDSLYRLSDAQYSDGKRFEYVYDAAGNRTTTYTRTITSTLVTAYTYDAANRLTTAGGVPYTWDDNGNLTNDGSQEYTYDRANRLTHITGPGLAWSAAYNGDGARLKQVTNGSVTTYTLDLAALLPVVLQVEDVGVSAHYVYAEDTHPLAGYAAGGWVHYLPDGLGSARQEVDAAGEVQAVRSFDPYGNTLDGDAGTPFGYTGEQHDAYTGLLFLRARYYDPVTGRFTQQDPLHASEFSPYVYASNNPLQYVDPSGLEDEQVWDPWDVRLCKSWRRPAWDLCVNIITNGKVPDQVRFATLRALYETVIIGMRVAPTITSGRYSFT